MKKTGLNKQIALIHLQKKHLGLSDDEYRTVLKSVTGKTSAAQLNYSEVSAVITAMNTLLKKAGKATLGYVNTQAGSSSKPTLLNAVNAKAHAVLGNHAADRLAGFLKKIQKSSLEACTPQELRRIMGFLSVVEKNSRTKTGAKA